MFDVGLILLIVVAIGIGWALGRYERENSESKLNEIKESTGAVPKEYFQGLNYLLNEKPDQAVDLFAKTIDVTADTVEIYLSLGSNFRKRGEVDRAIKIHQDLLARPNLEKRPSADIQLALGQDYLAAGLLDRAEGLLIDLIEQNGVHTEVATKLLISLYEQEKDWDKALVRASSVVTKNSTDELVAIAQYRCELAFQSIQDGDWGKARESLRKALVDDKGCVRASLMLAELDIRGGNYSSALEHLFQIRKQNPSYISESVELLATCFQSLGREEELIEYLDDCLKNSSDGLLATRFGDYAEALYGAEKAVALVSSHLLKHPSLSVLNWLLEHQRLNAAVKMEQYWRILKELVAGFIKKSARYHCSICGFKGNTLHWSCPSCKSWVGYRPSLLTEK